MLGTQNCPGCVYAGGTHLTNCPYRYSTFVPNIGGPTTCNLCGETYNVYEGHSCSFITRTITGTGSVSQPDGFAGVPAKDQPQGITPKEVREAGNKIEDPESQIAGWSPAPPRRPGCTPWTNMKDVVKPIDDFDILQASIKMLQATVNTKVKLLEAHIEALRTKYAKATRSSVPHTASGYNVGGCDLETMPKESVTGSPFAKREIESLQTPLLTDTFCKNCHEPIQLITTPSVRVWRHKKTRVIYCKPQAGPMNGWYNVIAKP